MYSKAVVNCGIAALYANPTRESELADEALFGMVVDIIEVEGDWFKVRTHYRYEGWAERCWFTCDEASVEAWGRRERLMVTAAFADVLANPDVRGPIVAAGLPRGSVVASDGGAVVGVGNNGAGGGAGSDVNDRWQRVILPDGRTGYMMRGRLGEHVTSWDVSDEDALRRKIIDTAFSYMGTSYRWGGKTALGIDCSGLTSVSYLLSGAIIYRDADIKPGFEMREIDPKDAKPADLLFTNDHVVMYLGDGKYIHSTSKQGSEGVVVNSLNPEDSDFRQDIRDDIVFAGSIFV